MLEHGQLEMGHARALLALEGADQDKAAREVVARQFSARQTESLVRRIKDRPKRGTRGTPPPDADLLRLQEQISDRLGAKVTIMDKRGKGRLVIEYHSLDELDGILERIH
jgi:ParB family chromosome partitioning protein